MAANHILSTDIDVSVADTVLITQNPFTYKSTLEIRLPLKRLQALLGFKVAIEEGGYPELHLDQQHLHISVEIIHG